MRKAPVLLIEAGVKVIDLSADFRLQDKDEWEHWYGQKHVLSRIFGPGRIRAAGSEQV